MIIVRKSTLGFPLRAVRPLSASETAALKAWYSGNNGQAPAAAAVLRTIHGMGCWLACDCRDPNNPPLLTTRELGSRLTLARMTNEGRAEHAPDCLFQRDPPAAGGNRCDKSYSKLTQDLAALKEHTGPVNTGTPNPRQGDGHSEVRPRLARVMFRILEEAGIHRRDIKALSDSGPTPQYQRIKAATRRLPLAGPITLEGLLFTHPDIFDDQDRLQYALNKPGSNWPDNRPPQGYFLAVADDIADRYLIFHHKEKPTQTLEVAGSVRKLARDGSQTRPPYWVLGLVAELPGSPGRCGLLQAYAHPVHSKAILVPVDSDYERKTLALLLRQQRYWLGRGVESEIEKPLHAIPVRVDGEKTRCQPDFLLRRRTVAGIDRTVVVETMGYDDPEYRERKTRTHQRMAQLGEVIEHRLYATEHGRTEAEIDQWLRKVLTAIMLK